jgi:hypothetical protein
MIGFRRLTLLAVAATALFACSPDEIQKRELSALESRAARLEARLARVDEQQSTNTPVAMWIMPRELREISGLALTRDGRLLAHDDEFSRVFEVDPRRGVIVKTFTLGRGMKGDFEGITVAGSDIYMVLSNGMLYRFREGANGDRVQFTTHDTRLGKECEFEGVAYEPDSPRLGLPFKQARGKGKDLDDEVVIYRWRIGSNDAAGITRMAVPLSDVVGSNGWKKFRPSDITLEPGTGNYVIVASLEKGIVVMRPDGEVVSSGPLPGKHEQAEGIAITPDNILIISDEATNKPAAVTLYRWQRSEPGDSPQ